MDRNDLAELLKSVQAGATSVDEALGRLDQCSLEDMGFAHVDHDRARRCGFPEVILAAGKTAEQVVAIAQAIGRLATGTRIAHSSSLLSRPLRLSAISFRSSRPKASSSSSVGTSFSSSLSSGGNEVPSS